MCFTLLPFYSITFLPFYFLLFYFFTFKRLNNNKSKETSLIYIKK